MKKPIKDRKSYNKKNFKKDYHQLRLILHFDNQKNLGQKWYDYEMWLYSDESEGFLNPIEKTMVNKNSSDYYIWRTNPRLSNCFSNNWLEWIKQQHDRQDVVF